jgi:membrane protease YdiL (CAAX protease family)
MTATASLWDKVPVFAKAPLSAILVLIAAVYPTSFLIQLNLAVLPGVPWSVLPGALYLWLLWRYIGGWGPPARTSSSRNHYRRCHPVPAGGRLWIWLAGAALAVTIFSYVMIKLLTESGGVQQVALLDALTPLPATTVLPLLAMLVLMTAFFEEAAFRGYMQVQLERRYRPAVAIFFTALLFAVVHFPAPGQLPLFVFGSLGWGVLTYLSRTILPAVVMHGVVDGVMFFWVWKNPAAFKALLEHNVLRTGASDLFIAWVVVAILGTASTIFGLFMLAKSKRVSADP